MSTRTARCACGALSARCEGEPLKVSLCHCRDCQRRTGSAFGIAAFFPETAVAVTGESCVFSRPSDAGPPVEHHFCPDCGSTVWWRALRLPDRIAVAVGAFADPAFPAPQQQVFQASRHPWLDDFA